MAHASDDGTSEIATGSAKVLSPSEMEERQNFLQAFVTSPADYDFLDALVGNNTATNGGGIYIESSAYSLPTFGPQVTITGNVATKYGGAIYFGTYLPVCFSSSSL